MKKKFLTILLAVCAVLACAFGISACGGSGGDDSPTVHSHKWSQEWDKDATHHWHNCTADGCDVTKNSEKDGYAVHDFTNGNCICGEKDPSAPTEGLKYTLNKDGESYSCTGKGTATDYEIVIASEYEGKPVTCIGTGAFYECIGLTSITIPDSVTSIGYGAFEGCSRLTSVIIPDSVTSIGGSEFSGCSSLESITVASENTKYHSSGNCLIETASKTLIAGCKNSVIPDDGSVTSIGVKAFLNCRGLTSITIGNSVTCIEGMAFSDCSRLTSVIILDSVTSIGYGAFSGCRGLTSITIGNSVTSIEGMAFSDCSSLESITVASENTKYHSSGNCLIETASKTLIAGCKNSVIPDDGSVTSIGEGAFIGCSGLTSITISDSVTSIGDKAFLNCLKLTSVIIPDSVTSIGSCAFEYCNMLTIYCEAESKPSGWDSSWNGTYSPVPVVWGYKG